MRRTLGPMLALMAVGLVYCGEATAPFGRIAFGLVSGDQQTVQAGADSLAQPVIGQAYRDGSGAVAFRVFGASPLLAQTPIGPGVPDVRTCAHPVGEGGMRAWRQCETTDSAGFVTYWFRPGTTASDSACAEIRDTSSGSGVVLATTCSAVRAGPAVRNLGFGTGEGPILVTGTDTIFGENETPPQDRYGNDVDWRFEVASGPAHVPAGMPKTLVADRLGTGEVHVLTEHSDTSFADMTIQMVAGQQEFQLTWRR
jgi:hypothetical protein